MPCRCKSPFENAGQPWRGVCRPLLCWTTTHATAATLEVSNACDLPVVPPGDGGLAGTLEAAPGDTIKLIADSTCVLEFTTSGELLSGDGIADADLLARMSRTPGSRSARRT